VSRRALFGRLAAAERVVQISAPAGSGKTVLMRSWISVADALRATAAGSMLVRPHVLATSMRSRMLQMLVRLGQTAQAEEALAGLREDQRDSAEMRIAAAALRLAIGDPQAAVDTLAPSWTARSWGSA
jgi:hypothetical protein